ncbi:DNA-binding protein, excisionase [Desulfitobacterium hafniense]|uniref:DNA-binding protein, excisionase n=1 Tax=Desulfitobacterium hafniense TaxID=49338 RepID=A0A098AWA3_DESHA|nr:helix-turn-helix domain-containing protein [Desulfitobacterium hafniense]CDX00868.1 DNA-binding protein, excisionase [Desulfitobacterium hafniense]
MQSKSEFLTKTDLAGVLNVTHSTIIRWISEGKVPLIKIGNKALISRESIPLIKSNIGFINTDEYMGLTEFLDFFKISHETYLNWIKRGWVKMSVQYGQKTYIPLSSIDEIKKLSGYVNEEDYISVKQLSSMLNLSPGKILRLIKSGLLVNCHQYKDKYLFKSDSIEDIKQSIGYIHDFNLNEYLRIYQVKEKLNLNFDFQYWKTKIPYILHMGTPYIHTKDLPLFYDVIKHKKSKPALTEDPGLENYVDTSKAAELLKISKSTLSQQINSGIIKGAIKVPFTTKQTKWMIPMESIVDYKQRRISLIKHKKAVLMPSNTINLKTISDKTGLSLQTLRLKVKNKQLFPNAQKVKGFYAIPIEEANKFIAAQSKPQYSKKNEIYTNKDALEELLSLISAFPLPFNLRKTQDFFVEFCKIKLSKLRGNPSHIQSFFGYYRSVFEILRTLNDNLYELDVSLIDSIMYKEITSEHKKRIFNHFYEYCYSAQGLPVPKKYVVSSTKKAKREKEIYSPEVFYSFYMYVKDITLHMPNAINNQYYANMWTYTIMHLTDAWRASDIVFNMPKIDISSIQVDSFDWFKINVLSITQCQKVINQLYLHFRSIRTSKTTTFVTFLVEPELVEPLSTALIISELHRQKEAQSFLLESFFNGERKTVATSGKARHQDFFKFNSSLEPFKSLKFNNTTLTYFFYSIGVEDGNDSDVALELTQRVRSHNRAETTAIYVQATNKDGSLNQVSSNLFRRGHFGWLYNYLIILASENANGIQTMEEKTEAILTLRNQLGSPNHTERWAQFLLQIKQKRNSVMTRLAKLSKESLSEMLIKIFKGEMPSKNENAQCITYPICEYQRLNSCYSCPNIIPKNYLFIELGGEFDRLINSIDTTQYNAIRKKDSYFLLNLLLLLDEGIKFFGEDYIEAFIKIQLVRDKLSHLADKIYIE